MPVRRAKTKPVQVAGGGDLIPRKTWNTGASFIAAAPVRPIDAPAPRKKSNNRRLPSSKEIKAMVPKKGKSSQKSLKPPPPEEDLPTKLDEEEEGHWDEKLGWISTASQGGSKKEEDEEDELDSADDSPPALMPSVSQASVEETSSRVIPPIHGHKVNSTQRAINRATTSSTANTTAPDPKRARPLTPTSLRLLHELEEEEEEEEAPPKWFRRSNNDTPLFDPHDSDSSEDLREVESELPPSTADRTLLSNSRTTASAQPRPSRVPDSVAFSSGRHVTNSGLGQIQEANAEEEEQEQDDEEAGEDPFEDKENVTTALPPAKRRKVMTYSKRVKHAYVNRERERTPYSRPPSPASSPPLPPGRNPALSKERSTTRDYSVEEVPRPPAQSRVRRPRVVPTYSYTEDEDDEDDEDQYPAPGHTEDTYDFDWDEELQAMFFTDSLESRTQHHRPEHMIPVTAAFPADRYFVPPQPVGPRGLPPRKVKPEYIPLFEDDHQVRLLFTQSRVDLGIGPARNHPRSIHIPKFKRKRPVMRAPPQPRHYTPGHTVRRLQTVPVKELRERYMHEEHRFPVDPRLLKFAAQKRLPPRRPKFRDEYRYPVEPRIVHPSDNPSEPLASFTSTIPPFYPTSRLALRQKGKGVHPTPRLQFTAGDPPSQPRLPTSLSTTPTRTRSHVTNTHTHTTSSGGGFTASATLPPSNPHPIHPLTFNRSGTSATTTPKEKHHRPFIPQNPRTPQRLARQPSQPAFLPYIPVEPEPFIPDPELFIPDEAPPSTHIADAENEIQTENQKEDEVENQDEDEDEMVPLDLGDGEVIMISRRELDDLNKVELDRLSDPSGRLKNRVDEIEEFETLNPAPQVPPTPQTSPPRARSVFGDITSAVASGERMSGIDITDHLLNLASRVADRGVQRPKDHHQRRLEERRERLEAKRRAELSERAEAAQAQQPVTPTASTSRTRTPSTRPPQGNAFATPAPTRQPSQPPPVHPPPVRTKSIRPRPDQPLPLQPALYPAKFVPPTTAPEEEPVKTPRKRAQSTANSQYKPPTRIDAPPPPEPTTSERILARLAKSFPAYAGALKPPSPPPRLPPRLGVGPVPPAPLKSALKRTRTSVV